MVERLLILPMDPGTRAAPHRSAASWQHLSRKSTMNITGQLNQVNEDVFHAATSLHTFLFKPQKGARIVGPHSWALLLSLPSCLGADKVDIPESLDGVS